MKQIIMTPQIHLFSSCKEFAESFALSGEDIVISNQYIYEPLFGSLELDVQVVYQENYGMGEPTDVMAEAMLEDIRKMGGRRIIAIGGGTVIDLAKVMAVSGNETVDELYDAAPNLTKFKELIIIPTTCGTGSEMTNISILNRTKIGTKMGLVSEAMYAEHAVLIPELLKGLPFSVFATSSIDALVHAVESCLSPNATAYTRMYSYEAIKMILQGYQKIVAEGKAARIGLMEDFLIASNYAGIAFGTAGCAAVHATSYPLGGKYHVPHGESNYAMFIGVLEKYMEKKTDGELARLNQYLAGLLNCEAEKVYPKLDELLSQILMKKPLREYGMTESDISEFAHTVMETQQRLLKNNYTELSEEDLADVYRKLH